MFDVSLHSSSEGEMLSTLNRPRLVDVISGGKYSGHKLKMLIGALQTKLNSNAPTEEFKVRICFVALFLFSSLVIMGKYEAL